MRNAIMHSEDPLGEIMDEAYLSGEFTKNAQHLIPNDPVLPLVLDEVYRCGDVVDIDYKIPGCAPSADVMFYVITEVLAGTFTLDDSWGFDVVAQSLRERVEHHGVSTWTRSC